MSLTDLPTIILAFVLLLPAIIVHEVSHGYMAYRLGDPTAKNAGRLTLNPIDHIDLWGTIIMPVLLFTLSGGRVAFGYAKPVPINPVYFRNRRLGMLLTGIAGPGSNLLMAVGGALLYRGLELVEGLPSIVADIAWLFTLLNVLLMFFNMIPIPPMDGSRVVQYFLPEGALRLYSRIEMYGLLIVLVLLTLGRPLLEWYFFATVVPTMELLTGVMR